MQFQPTKPRRAVDDIIEQVRVMLDEGTLTPGMKLPSEREFAEQLAVSRNTVREALRMLEVAGLITIKRGATGGAYVVDSNTQAITQSLVDGMTLTKYTLLDIIEARIAIETSAVIKVVENATDDELDELDELVAQSAAIDPQADWEGRLASYFRFHDRLIELSGNPIFPVIARPLHEMANRVSARIGSFAGDVIIQSRHRLMHALHARDAEAAVAELRSYLELLYERWVSRPID
ncbi:GntR family transcriptional regulator [Microbacterium sp. NPDC096154]|uniref:FadR/GntR family transcriptional regulator n=1 Tax=Microbacterium sp. NPDC096154 TaxID=3155549 RepID=UPI00333183C2